jgi:hypothetical protein
MTVFATRRVTKGRGKRQRFVEEGVAWQAWNNDARMERATARLAGSGSFYWPDAQAAYRRAIVMFRQDDTIQAIRIEGIGGQDVGYLRRENVPPSFGCHPGQPELIARF